MVALRIQKAEPRVDCTEHMKGEPRLLGWEIVGEAWRGNAPRVEAELLHQKKLMKKSLQVRREAEKVGGDSYHLIR